MNDASHGKITAARRLPVLLFFVLLAALGAATYWGGFFHRMPSDSELKKKFLRNQSDFDKLVEMSNQDTHVTRIRPNLTYLDTDASWPRENIGFSEDRWNEYRHMFRRLDIDGGLIRRTDYPSSVFISVYTSGGVLGSSDKGYAYSVNPLDPLVGSLDLMPRELYNKNKGHAIVFRQLAGNWYMYREEF